MIHQLYKIVSGFNRKLKTEDLVLKGILDGALAFRGPKTVQFDITNRCNNNCLCCWNNSPLLGEQSAKNKKEKESELPFPLVKKVISELKKIGTDTLFFAGGGEPFMHPDIMQILRFAKKCDMRLFINTNFTLIDRKIAQEIVELKIDLVHVSLLAGSPETYVTVHPNKTEATFYKIKDTLQYLLSQRKIKRQEAPISFPHIDLYYVIFNKNYRDISKMVELAMELRVNSLEFMPIDVIPGKTDKLLLNDAQRNEVLAEVKFQKKRLDDFNRQEGGCVTFIEQYDSFVERMSVDTARQGTYDTKVVINQPCYAGWAFARVLANGNVNPCLKAHRISIGNIYAQSFRDIWNSPKQQMFRRKSFKPQKQDKYLKVIGNNPNTELGCLNACDNIQINIDMHNIYRDILRKNGKIE